MSRTLPVNRFTTTAQGLVPAPVTSNGWALIDTGAWGVVPTSGLGAGTADASKFLRGDGTWNNTLTATAASTAFTVTGAATTAYAPSVLFTAPATTSQSNGLQIKAGTNINDAPFVVTTGLLGTPYNQLAMLGDGSWSFGRSGSVATLACTSVGNVTIGAPTSTPATFGNFSLSVACNTTAGASNGLYVAAGTNATDNCVFVANAANTIQFFKIDGSGRVGVGASGPDATFSVVAPSTLGGLRVAYNGTSNNYYDADTHTFRTGAAAPSLTINGQTYATFLPNNSGFSAPANGVAGIQINNASSTMQSCLEFQKAGVISGRVRNDYVGSMSYVATGSGSHVFYTGGDSGTGLSAFIIAAGGALSVTLAATTTAPAAGGAGALPATPAGYAAITINGTARRIPYYT